MSHDRFPRTGLLHKGYHRRQVDRFINHVEVSLNGVFPAPTAADVRQAGFEMVHNGYDTVAVDEAMDALEERVLTAQRALAGRRGRVDPGGEAEFLRSELVAPYMQRFPRAKALHRGYDMDDVDDFIDRVVAALDGETELTVEEVRGAPFRPRRGGYREDAVDEMLDRVVELFLLIRRETADGQIRLPRRDHREQSRPPADTGA
jgi:DivIVA domain-containing protein